ncbi:MAG: universal stress protein [Caldilineaceae bacterium]
MSEQERTPSDNRRTTIQRIVVALDATPQSAILLDAAADLAHKLQIELVGLFVEDINLLRLAELPFSREIGSFSSARRSLQAAPLERQLRAQASQLRRRLQRTAEQHGIAWSFQVVRGAIAEELRKAALETDLFILGRSRRLRAGHFPLGTTTRALLLQAPRLTLVLHHHRSQWQQPIVVAYDGSAAAERALLVATQLTKEEDATLIVLLISEEQEGAQELRQQAAAWLHQRGLRARYQWLARANITRMANLVMLEQGGAFVLPSNGLAVQDAAVLAALESVQCPVLIVR